MRSAPISPCCCRRHIGFAGTFVAAPVLVGLLGIAIERLLFRRFYRADPILSLLLTFGLAMVAEQGLRMIFGASPLPYAMPDFLRGQLFLGDFIYPKNRLVMLVIAAVAVTLTWFLIYRTPFGRVVRAGVQDPEMVGALGISLEPYMMAIAAIGVGLAGTCRRAARLDRHGPPRDGAGDPHRRLRGGGDRRARLVLGRGRGRAAGRRRARRHDLFRAGRERSLDVPA